VPTRIRHFGRQLCYVIAAQWLRVQAIFYGVVAYRRQSILCNEAIRNALRTSIETVRVARPFVIDAWILLPDHLHCVWALPDGDADFSTCWMIIKLPAWAQRRAHPT